MSVFSTRFDLLDSRFIDGADLSLRDATVCARNLMQQMAIPEGLPIIIDSSGNFDFVLHDFLMSLSSSGAISVNTWSAYAKDLLLFKNYLLDIGGRGSLLDVTHYDLAKYYRIRRLQVQSESGKKPVKDATWKRQMTSFGKFFEWAVTEKMIDSSPLTASPFKGGPKFYRKTTTVTPDAGRVPLIKCVSMEHYKEFRDIGLRAVWDPDGEARPRMALRNVAFAQVAVTTGLRAVENTGLLHVEIPWRESKIDTAVAIKLRVGAGTAKGGYERDVYLSRDVIKKYLEPYSSIERAHAIAKAKSLGRYKLGHKTWLLCRELSAQSCQVLVNGAWIRRELAGLNFSERTRLMEVDDDLNIVGPASLWVAETGAPSQISSFSSVFQRACDLREAKTGIRQNISLHTLRHTFAVYTLSMLIKGMVARIADERASNKSRSSNQYSHFVYDPLRILQKLMGHASQDTTQIYLTYVQDAQKLAEEAAGEWAARMSGVSESVIQEIEGL